MQDKYAASLSQIIINTYFWSSAGLKCNRVGIRGSSKSQLIIPIALERFSPPLTRPSMVTFPPAFLIRASSTSSSGLWSYDISTALPAENLEDYPEDLSLKDLSEEFQC